MTHALGKSPEHPSRHGKPNVNFRYSLGCHHKYMYQAPCAVRLLNDKICIKPCPVIEHEPCFTTGICINNLAAACTEGSNAGDSGLVEKDRFAQ